MPNEASKQSRSPRRELAPHFPVHCDEKKPGSRGRERSWVLGLDMMSTQGRTFSSKDCDRITRPSHLQSQRRAGIGRRLCMQTAREDGEKSLLYSSRDTARGEEERQHLGDQGE